MYHSIVTTDSVTMKIATLIQILLFLKSAYSDGVEKNFVPLSFNQNVSDYIEQSTDCIFEIAKKYFEYSSITCILTAGLPNIKSTISRPKSAYGMTFTKLMESNKWNIMIKSMNSFQVTVTFVIYLLFYFVLL